MQKINGVFLIFFGQTFTLQCRWVKEGKQIWRRKTEILVSWNGKNPMDAGERDGMVKTL